MISVVLAMWIRFHSHMATKPKYPHPNTRPPLDKKTASRQILDSAMKNVYDVLSIQV